MFAAQLSSRLQCTGLHHGEFSSGKSSSSSSPLVDRASRRARRAYLRTQPRSRPRLRPAFDWFLHLRLPVRNSILGWVFYDRVRFGVRLLVLLYSACSEVSASPSATAPKSKSCLLGWMDCRPSNKICCGSVPSEVGLFFLRLHRFFSLLGRDCGFLDLIRRSSMPRITGMEEIVC